MFDSPIVSRAPVVEPAPFRAESVPSLLRDVSFYYYPD